MTLKTIDNITYRLKDNNIAFVADNRKNENIPQNLVIPTYVMDGNKNYSITEIESYAFHYVYRIKTLKLSEGLKIIHNGAFDRAGFSEDKLIFPSTVTSLGSYSFPSNDIKSVVISKYITSIGDCPFGNNRNLVSITVEDGSRHFSCDNQGALYNKKQTRLIQTPPTLEILNIPQSVYLLGSQTVDVMLKLKIIYINGNIKKYAQNSINCPSLETVFYSGTSFVKSIFNSKPPKTVFVCKGYKGETFGDVSVNITGNCNDLKKLCTKLPKRCMYNPILIWFMSLLLC